jgi:hypothetical protein
MSLLGIGQGPSTNKFIYLSFYFVITAYKSIPFTVEVYIINHLSPGVLLRTSFLALYSLNVVWAKNKDQVDALVYRDK